MISRHLRKSSKNILNLISKSFQNLNDVSYLTPEQQEIQQMAYNFAQQKMLPFAAEWDQKGHHPVDIIREIGKQGFGSVYTKTEYGGAGLGRLEASLIFEALSTACIATTDWVTVHNMNSWIIDTFGNDEQKKNWLTKLTSMEWLSSYCLTEPNAGSDAFSLKTSAKQDGTDYILNGSKAFITGGGVSDFYVVMAKTGKDEVSAFGLEKNTKGVSFGKFEKKMGWKSSPTTVVSFDDVRIPASNMISTKGMGFKIAMQGLNTGRINIASSAIGGAAFCIEEAKKYIKTRKQFGKVLADNQYLSFKMADMATNLVACRYFVRHAAKYQDIDHPQKIMFAAMTKKFVTDNCFEIADNAMQLFGGYGYLEEYPIERVFRDLRVLRILEGTNEIMRLLISRAVLKDE